MYHSGMRPMIEINNWDAIRNTRGDVVIIVPPIPRPVLAIVALDAVYVLTSGLPVRLVGSLGILDTVDTARTLVIAEADERIVRETLVSVAATAYAMDERTGNELEAA
jgi:hypothetical protein